MPGCEFYLGVFPLESGQPAQAFLRPRMSHEQSLAVPSFFIDVKLERNRGFPQSLCIENAVLTGDGGVLHGMPQKGRRGFRGYAAFLAQRLAVFLAAVFLAEQIEK